jgi:hypothetical protein
MNEFLLVPAVWLTVRYRTARDQIVSRARHGWRDATGAIDLSLSHMIWLGAAIVVGVPAIAFATAMYIKARDHVPDPTGGPPTT